jgi:hypothetical protein
MLGRKGVSEEDIEDKPCVMKEWSEWGGYRGY